MRVKQKTITIDLNIAGIIAYYHGYFSNHRVLANTFAGCLTQLAHSIPNRGFV